MGGGLSRVHLQLPDAVGISERLTDASRAIDDDAASNGIGVASSASLTLLVTYSDGAVKDLSTDTRARRTRSSRWGAPSSPARARSQS